MICVAFLILILPKFHFYSILNVILRFTKEEVQKQVFPFVAARYIRTFDVIFEVNCIRIVIVSKVDTMEEAEVRKNCAISEF